MVALIIEDGTGVANADSYITLVEARAYAAKRGLSLPASPAGDAELEQLLIKAMDYIEAKRDEFQGTKTESDQSLQWPRSGVTIDGFEIDDDFIPKALKDAQAQLAVDGQTTDLMPAGTGREVIKEKVDVIEVQYAEQGSGSVQPVFTKAEALLAPLLERGVTGFALSSVRV